LKKVYFLKLLFQYKNTNGVSTLHKLECHGGVGLSARYSYPTLKEYFF